MKGQRTYDGATRKLAMEIAEEEGAVAASRKTGVPPGTIRSWRSRSGKSGPPSGIELDDWGQIKRDGACETWIAAREALAYVRRLLAEERAGEAQKAALTMAILTDKSVVLESAAQRAEEHQVRLGAEQGRILVRIIESFLADLGIPSSGAIGQVLGHHLRSGSRGGATSPSPETAEARAQVEAALLDSTTRNRHPR